MAEFALPCIACGKQLQNSFEDVENQPSEGTAFHTHGHYGSTIFDPMDGQYLELNVCDDCLRKHSDRVLLSRKAKPVLCDGVLVGWCKTPGRPLMPWNPDLEEPTFDRAEGDNVLHVEREDIGSDLYPEIEWTKGAMAWAEDLKEGHDA